MTDEMRYTAGIYPEQERMMDKQVAASEVRDLAKRGSDAMQQFYDTIHTELLRLAGENARLNKIESLATEQRLQMEDVELYLMDVSQPDDEDAPWCDRMKSAIELLVQDCNDAVGQKNKAEAELAALRKRVDDAPTGTLLVNYSHGQPISANVAADDGEALAAIDRRSVRLLVDDA